MPRFSIRQLLIATAVAAVGCFALLNASQIWAATLLSGVGLILAASILLAVFRDGERRAYWIGFATFGWLYLLLCFGGFFIFSADSNPFGWRKNIVAQLADILYDQTHKIAKEKRRSPYNPPPADDPFAPPAPAPPPEPPDNPPPADDPFAPPDPFAGPDRSEFLLVAHSLWTLLLAVSGGWFAHWLYVTRRKV